MGSSKTDIKFGLICAGQVIKCGSFRIWGLEGFFIAKTNPETESWVLGIWKNLNRFQNSTTFQHYCIVSDGSENKYVWSELTLSEIYEIVEWL